ncbi:tetratricopeptide repeat protein [Streptomyces sp. NPDC059740]|uniref:tetratricopeptide repeat protein n=1 Tax=Streptomyces sp. NPDC059740 TaxID=3346926 RepID=UPI0036647780
MTDQAVGPEHPGTDREPAAPPPPAAGAAAPAAPTVPGQASGGRRTPRVPRSRSETGREVPLGREREVAGLLADIERTGLDTLAGRRGARSRILLIAGAPGSGRTTLAEELLAEVAADYPDGVLRAVLSTPDGRPADLARVARDLLANLGAPLVAGADEDEVTQALRDALTGRRAVLLLDDAAGADQVHTLLPDSPGCLVLVISEGPLTGITDVRPCTLGGLERGPAVTLLARRAGSTRITVDPCSAEEVVEECAGLPAALRLAAGWLAARPMASVADLLRGLRAAEPPGRPAAAARPIARALTLVVAGLPATTARLARLLALAPAGLVDAHVAAALVGVSVADADAALAELTRRGMLDALPEDGTEHRRYRVPGALAPLLADLLADRERPAETEVARARMLERLVRLLRSCRAVTRPPGSAARRHAAALPRALRFPSAAAAAGWLESRRVLLLEAARCAVTEGELETLDRRLVSALVGALLAHRGAAGAAPDLYGLHSLVLQVAERRNLPAEGAAALLNLGDLDVRAGRLAQALPRYRRALDAARRVPDPAAEGRALESLGETYARCEDWQRAADWYGRALELRQARGEETDEARLHERLAAALAAAHRWEEALRSWRSAAGTHRRLGDLAGQAHALVAAAAVLEKAGRPSDALRTCQEALRLAREAAVPEAVGAAHLRIAELLPVLGDEEGARRHRERGIRLLSPASAPAPPASEGAPQRPEGPDGTGPSAGESAEGEGEATDNGARAAEGVRAVVTGAGAGEEALHTVESTSPTPGDLRNR